MFRTRVFALAVAATSLALASPRSAWAGDAPPAANDATAQIAAVLKELDTAQAAKDEAALSVAAKKLPALYKATQDGALKGSIMSALGKLVKQSKMTSARKDAMNALAETEDGKEAWKAVQAAYPADDIDDPTRFNNEFVTFVGELHPDAAIDKLLDSFRKGKMADYAAAAVKALGKYHKSKQRERILEEIVKAGKNMAPSRSATKAPSADAQARWAVVGEGIGAALDELTGEKVGNPVEWFKKVDESKKNYKQFFKD